MALRKESILFSPSRIGTVALKNRLVRSATYENAATGEGKVTDRLLSLYGKLAEGGAGLIVTGITGVHPKAHSPHFMMCVHDDSFIPGLTELARKIHETDRGCKVMLQLHHPGRQIINPKDAAQVAPFRAPAFVSCTERYPEFSEPPAKTASPVEPTAPSAVFDRMFDRYPRALATEEIEEIIMAFVEGIRRAREAGFDGVQLHAAHGWLLSSFLSPHTNKRNDRYGGSTENRTRIVREIRARARTIAGDDFPVLIKFNTTDFLPEGTDLSEAIRIAKLLAGAGFDAIEASGGMWECVIRGKKELGWPAVFLPESRTKIGSKDRQAYFLDAAKALKQSIDIPIITVGGIRSFSMAEEILSSQWADFVSLSRPLIRQPDLPNLWQTGMGDGTAQCISCNACLPFRDYRLVCRARKG